MANDQRNFGTWDAAECALVFIDYQDHMMELIFEQDRRLIELNIRTLAKMASELRIPVILSTVGVEMGVNGPTIPALREVLPDVEDIDRSSMNAWEDVQFLEAVKATRRRRLVMCGIATSVCLAYPVVDALADGYEVTFVEDAVADAFKELHDTAVMRLAQAGAVPNTTVGMIAEWFRDWKSPSAQPWRKLAIPYFEELAALKSAPEYHKPHGLVVSTNN